MRGILDCPCGCGTELNSEFVKLLETIEAELKLKLQNYEMYITSGARCEKYNNEQGHTKNSAHTLGLAADIRIDNSHQLFLLWQAILKSGIKRIGDGINRNFIHIDIAKGKLKYPHNKMTEYPQEIVWSY